MGSLTRKQLRLFSGTRGNKQDDAELAFKILNFNKAAEVDTGVERVEKMRERQITTRAIDVPLFEHD